MNKKVSKTFLLTEDLFEKLKILQQEKSFSTTSATLQYCISEAFERQIRNERRVKSGGVNEEKLDIDERRKQREIDHCKKIAEKLGGTLIKSGDGFNVEYFTHSKHGSYKQVMPLLSLTEELVDKQWFPSREIVEEYWKKNKK